MSLPVGSHEGIETYVAHRTSRTQRPGGRGGTVPATFQGFRPPSLRGVCSMLPWPNSARRQGPCDGSYRCLGRGVGWGHRSWCCAAVSPHLPIQLPPDIAARRTEETATHRGANHRSEPVPRVFDHCSIQALLIQAVVWSSAVTGRPMLDYQHGRRWSGLAEWGATPRPRPCNDHLPEPSGSITRSDSDLSRTRRPRGPAHPTISPLRLRRTPPRPSCAGRPRSCRPHLRRRTRDHKPTSARYQ